MHEALLFALLFAANHWNGAIIMVSRVGKDTVTSCTFELLRPGTGWALTWQNALQPKRRRSMVRKKGDRSASSLLQISLRRDLKRTLLPTFSFLFIIRSRNQQSLKSPSPRSTFAIILYFISYHYQDVLHVLPIPLFICRADRLRTSRQFLF